MTAILIKHNCYIIYNLSLLLEILCPEICSRGKQPRYLVSYYGLQTKFCMPEELQTLKGHSTVSQVLKGVGVFGAHTHSCTAG